MPGGIIPDKTPLMERTWLVYRSLGTLAPAFLRNGYKSVVPALFVLLTDELHNEATVIKRTYSTKRTDPLRDSFEKEARN
jgi:hypothetical protein